jgi:hypothetical protein
MKKLKITLVHQGLALTSDEDFDQSRVDEIENIKKLIVHGERPIPITFVQGGQVKFITPKYLEDSVIVTEIYEVEEAKDEKPKKKGKK